MTREFSNELEALNFINKEYSNRQIENFDIQYRVIDEKFKKFDCRTMFDKINSIILNYKYLAIDTFSLDLGNEKVYLFGNVIEVLR